VTIGVAVNPLILWLWIGGGVMALGTLVALAPSLPRPFWRQQVASEATRRRQNEQEEEEKEPVPV
jgi:hypothetical protein